MSACISRAGEFSEHVTAETGRAAERLVCTRCGATDEERLLAELDAAENRLSNVAAAWQRAAREISIEKDEQRRESEAVVRELRARVDDLTYTLDRIAALCDRERRAHRGGAAMVLVEDIDAAFAAGGPS